MGITLSRNPRYLIEISETGIAIKDTVTESYVVDASMITEHGDVIVRGKPDKDNSDTFHAFKVGKARRDRLY